MNKENQMEGGNEKIWENLENIAKLDHGIKWHMNKQVCVDNDHEP